MKRKSVRKRLSETSVARLMNSDLNDDVREIEREIRQGERWVIERRKFFIKLAILTGMILILLVFSHFYLA
ncbi:MAG: hypothetical protein WC438_03835 [Candidatus Pacearchaeota archaeon]